MIEPGERPGTSEPDARPAADDAGTRGHRGWVTRAAQYRSELERRPRLGLPLRSLRRFTEIDGQHLALVIAANLFIAVIPLLILGYALFVSFNPHRSFGHVLVDTFHLSGNTARIVQDTFTNARSGQSTALSISVISLLITGFDISATVQLAYARAFRVAPLSGARKYLRGAAWLIILLAVTAGGLTLRYFGSGHAAWYLLLLIPVYLVFQFAFFLVTPQLLLDLPFAWRDLARGAAVSAVAAVLIAAVSSFELRRWISAYGHAYGGFGIALSIIAYVGLLALFWVWVAAVMGAYWEHEAGSAAVAAMQEKSTEIDR